MATSVASWASCRTLACSARPKQRIAAPQNRLRPNSAVGEWESGISSRSELPSTAMAMHGKARGKRSL